MRSIYTTLLGIIFSITVFAQSSFDTTYTREWNAKAESWTYFDRIISEYEDGQLLSELVQVFEDDDWANYNFITYNYSNGQVIEELENFWDHRNQEWVRSYRKLFSYSDACLDFLEQLFLFYYTG